MVRQAETKDDPTPFFDPNVEIETRMDRTFLIAKAGWGKRRAILQKFSVAVRGIIDIQAQIAGHTVERMLKARRALINRRVSEAAARGETINSEDVVLTDQEITDEAFKSYDINEDAATLKDSNLVFNLMETLPVTLTECLWILIAGQKEVVLDEKGERRYEDISTDPGSAEVKQLVDEAFDDKDIYEICAPFFLHLPNTFASYLTKIQSGLEMQAQSQTQSLETKTESKKPKK